MGFSKIEQKVYRSYYRDGIIDIGVGLGVLLFGISMITDFDYVSIFIALLIPIGMELKKQLVYSRIGYVKFSDNSERKEKKKLINLFLFGLLALFSGIFLYLLLISRSSIELKDFLNPMLMLGVLLSISFIFIAYQYGIKSIYIYSALIFLPYLLEKLLMLNPGSIMIGTGLIILFIGFKSLFSF